MTYKKLVELADVESGGTPSRRIPTFWGGNIPWIKISNITSDLTCEYDETITEDGLKNSSAKIFKKGTILYTIFATLGETSILGIDAATNQAIAGITIKDQSILAKYLLYFLKSIKNKIVSAGQGVAQHNINLSILRDVNVPCPALSSQQTVIFCLDSLSEAIRREKEEMALLDSLVKSRFMEMFQFSEKSSPSICLEDLTEFVTVGIANSATQAYRESGVPMLRNQNIRENRLDDGDLVFIDEKFAEKYASKKLKHNDILITRTGYPGIACLVPEKFENCQTFTTLICRLKSDAPVTPGFLCHFINSPLGKEYVKKNQVGVAQQNFGAKQLAKMPIKVPSKELQDKFLSFAEAANKSVVIIEKEIRDYQELFDSKMQLYFGVL